MLNKIKAVQDRLRCFINRLTIRSVLFTGFALVIVLAILTDLLAEWTNDQAMDALNKLITVDNEISDLCLKSITLMVDARRNEKDFILNYKDFGFNEAKARYISRVLSSLADVKGNMKKIRLLTTEPETARQTGEIEQAVGQYQDKLLVMVEKYERIGSYDSGLEREFRDTAHELENLLKGRKNELLVADLLSMRRAEKDFIARNRDYDAAELQMAIVRFMSDTAGSGLPPELKEKLGKLADTYRARFEEYVKTVEEIRTVKKSYLKSVQIIEPSLEKLYLHTLLEVDKSFIKIRQDARLFTTMKASASLLALLVAIAAAIFISVNISRSLNESKSFAEQIAAGNLGNRLAEKGTKEFVSLAFSLNSMAESLQTADLAQKKSTAEQRESAEKIRELNADLERKVEERTRRLLEAQEELVRKEKLSTLGQIAGSVGHELRNPLGVMNNAVYYLQMVLSDADKTTREYLDIIKCEIATSDRIVSDLLDAARTKPPQPREVQADELIRMSLEKCNIPERIRVEVEYDTRRTVLIDPLQMKQVFINLINNAVEAMPEGGELRIRARATKDEGLTRDEGRGTRDEETFRPSSVEIAVADTGTGITPEDMKKLFQPLFTTKARGIGLGLVVVKNLTEANGGNVAVESTLGKGTTFSVSLPIGVNEPQA